MGLLLWVCSGAAPAQVSTLRTPEREIALPAGRVQARIAGLAARAGAEPIASMELRFKVTDEHALFADARRAPDAAAGPADGGYRTRLGLEWRPAKATLGLEQGALGMQLESGYRLSLRLRHGGPSLYVRSQF